jgi:hypothetical protein
MDRSTRTVENLIREGFTLMLELRRQSDAVRLIPIANAFLRTLLEQTSADAPPLVVSVKAVAVRKR